MRSSGRGLAVRELGRLWGRSAAGPASGDGALLAHFLAGGGDRAFESLVDRHGPMVLGVCRRLLGSPHDADDAFQATFLVLARKAAHLRDPDRLGPWLYGVATRVATRARARAARHRHEPLGEPSAPAPSAGDWSDVRPVLDAELNRLPARHRDVLVLCLLEGATTEEASRRLGCPVGTVKSRLSRGREALRARLIGRGVAPAVALAALSAPAAFASPVPRNLARAALATTATTAVAPGVAALTKGATTIMLWKSTTAAGLCGGVALAGLITAAWLRPSLGQAPGPAAPGQPAPAPVPEPVRTRTDHMRQVLLAFHNYISANDRLPPAATTSPDNKRLLSWRVALLPYLDQAELFREFRQNEPWDSPHNKALVARMPEVFQTPDLPAPPGETRLRGFEGPGTLFDGNEGVSLAEVTDGTSNTLLIALARDATPWTKPGELPLAPGPVAAFLDFGDPAGAPLGMADGSVRPLPKAGGMVLPALITRAGNEVVDWSRPGWPMIVSAGYPNLPPTEPRGGMMAGMMSPPPGAPGAGMMAGMMSPPPGAPGAAPPQALERRLQRVEEKLDRLLKKFDAAFPNGAPSK